ncbi:MAG: AI-2E family transporter [Gammaproteobacteria bacterium]|nr:MAG: AI-2E family transporter [Gammaproteobacteria bacterium]
MNQILDPVKRLLINRQFTAMLIVIIMFALAVIYTGRILTPFFAAIVIAYLLEGMVARLTRLGRVRRFFMVNVVFLLFLLFLGGILLWAVPELGRQAQQAASNVPVYMNAGEELILRLPEKYPNVISKDQAADMLGKINAEMSGLAKSALSGGVFKPLMWLLSFVIYLILVPVMVYFMLKDKDSIIAYLNKNLPLDNPLLRSVWEDVDTQIGNYIRGKVTEILIIWFVCYVAFMLLGLDYAMLLSFMVGLSVLIPYIGATVVTLPVLIVGFVQWGLGGQFYALATAYFIIQILDGNVLVPLIFSEAVSIHPVAIIVAILLFGGIWGFWGVFFAIPLATLVNAIINAWRDSIEELEAGLEE